MHYRDCHLRISLCSCDAVFFPSGNEAIVYFVVVFGGCVIPTTCPNFFNHNQSNLIEFSKYATVIVLFLFLFYSTDNLWFPHTQTLMHAHTHPIAIDSICGGDESKKATKSLDSEIAFPIRPT